MTAEGTACNGAGEAPKAEFPQGKAAPAPPEEKAAADRVGEGEDVGGPFVIVNGGDSDGHSDRGSDLGRAPDEDSPSEEEDVPASNAAPDAAAGGDHGASGGEVSAPGAVLVASSADGADRAADGAEGDSDEGRGEPSSDFVTQVPRQEVAGEEHGGAAASASSASDPAVTGVDSEAPAMDSEVEGKEETVDESAATDSAESVMHEVASKEQDGEDAAVESLGHDGAPLPAESSSAAMESGANGEDSKEEQSAADVVEPVDEGIDDACALMANVHVCADMRSDSFEASTEPESHANESKPEQNATEIAESAEGNAVREDGTDASQTNGHICVALSSDSCIVASESEDRAIETEGQETNQQEEGAQPAKDEVLEGLLEAADRNCEGSVEELIEEEVNADGHSNAEGGADASRESDVDKQVQGEATCGIFQLEEKQSSNEGVELPMEKVTNEAAPDMCEPEEVTENMSQDTVQGEAKDRVPICTLHSLKPEESDPSVKSSLEHNVHDGTTAESDLRADNVVEVETAAIEVEEIEVKDEANLAPFLSQQNCESSTETVKVVSRNS